MRGGAGRANRRVRDQTTVFRGSIIPYLAGDHDGSAVAHPVTGKPVITLPAGLWTVGELADVGTTMTITKTRTEQYYLAPAVEGTAILDHGYYGGVGTGLRFKAAAGVLNAKLTLGGIAQKRGTITVHSTSDLKFFRCDLTHNPIDWWAKVVAAIEALDGGLPDLIFSDRDPFNSGVHAYGPGTPVGVNQVGFTKAQWTQIADAMAGNFFGPLRIEGAQGACQRVGLHACNVHDSIDDGAYMASLGLGYLKGCNIYGISEFIVQLDGDGVSADPGRNPYSSTVEDSFHNDAAQLGDSGWSPTIQNNWLANRIMWSGSVNPSKAGGDGWAVNIRDNWFGGTLGGSVSDGRGYTTGFTKRISDVYPTWPGRTNDSFPSKPGVVVAASTSDAPDWSGDIVDNKYIARSGSAVSYSVAAKSFFTNLNETNNPRYVPSDVTDVFNQAQILASAENPAKLFQALAANAYDQMTVVS